MVYTEIISFIRGSTLALDTKKGELSLEQYETLGQKMSPAFASLRAEIYQLYLQYKIIKAELHVYDKVFILRHGVYLPHFCLRQLDPIHHIYRYVKRVGYWGPSFHRIFVDEVQDVCTSTRRGAYADRSITSSHRQS